MADLTLEASLYDTLDGSLLLAKTYTQAPKENGEE